MGERRGGWIRRTLDAPAADGAAPAVTAGAPARITTIERGCEIEGDLSLAGPLIVHGDFRGSIECGDVVTVGVGGSVQARIRARSVEILGSVVGDVEARRDVVLHAGARLHGDVKTPSLVIERGSFFNGRTEMAPPLPRRTHAAATASAQPKLSDS
jgi:cytoskeletal protein CcmA (bactofilin family)